MDPYPFPSTIIFVGFVVVFCFVSSFAFTYIKYVFICFYISFQTHGHTYSETSEQPSWGQVIDLCRELGPSQRL